MPVVDRSSPLPLWAQVLDDLRRRLDTGEFDRAFPTDLQLTEHYGVSRHTAREAVRRLQHEGVIQRERGRGTFVTRPSIEQPTGAIYSLFRSIEARGLEQRSQVLDLSSCRDEEIAVRLDLNPRAGLIRLERLRSADGQPLAHDTAWMPEAIGRDLLDVDFGHTALYDELSRRSGVRPTSGTEWIDTELPSPDERRLLGVNSRQPVFRIRRLARAGERAIEWRETVIRGDRYTFVAEWTDAGGYETVLRASDG